MDEDDFLGDFFDDIDIDDSIFTTVQTLADEDAELAEFEVDDDIFDIVASTLEDYGEGLKPDFEYDRDRFPPVSIAPEQVYFEGTNPELYSRLPNMPGLGYKQLVFSDGVHVRVRAFGSRQRGIIIGRSTKVFGPRIVEPVDVMSRYENLSENSSSRASGLGYSVFAHGLACMYLAKAFPSAVLEPAEGHDLTTNVGKFEVTGANWKRRQTGADFVISKYRIMKYCLPLSDDLLSVAYYSEKEDTKDTGMFMDSAFAQEPSPYSEYVKRIHDVMRVMSNRTRESLVGAFKHWLAHQDRIEDKAMTQVVDTTVITQTIELGTKKNEITGLKLLPSYFRVEAPSSDLPCDIDDLQRISIRPYTGVDSIGSTFHTVPWDTYNLEEIFKSARYVIPSPFYETNRPVSKVFQRLLRSAAFSSVYIESELFSKIHGGQGCFFSPYSRVGISWKLIRTSSLTYFVSFYTYEKPSNERMYGRWHRVESEVCELWQSPTFKISVQEQAFGQVVPYRYASMMYSLRAYCRPHEMREIIRKLTLILPLISGSTWKTSQLAADSRFFTLCSMTKTGDIQRMIRASCQCIAGKPLSGADSSYLWLLRRGVNKWSEERHRNTPMLGLPQRFMSIEKDLPQMFQWHIRGKEHASRCMSKMLEGMREEIQNRDDLQRYMEEQAGFFEKMVTIGVDQEEFNYIMDSAPDSVSYNHLLFTVLAQASCEDMKKLGEQRAKGTKIRFADILTDHNCIRLMPSGELTPSTVMSSEKIHDAIRMIHNDYGRPRSILSLLARMARGPKIPYLYGVHPKDAKSSDREISQMTGQQRIPQAISEAMCSIYCDEEGCDMMQDPEKPSKFVDTFTRVMAQRGTVSSEDKSFFAGRITPEFLSLVVGQVGFITGSTSLILASSLIRTDRSRMVALPVEADEELVSDIEEAGRIERKEGKKTKKVKMIKLFSHMQQGIRAIAAAVLSTVYSKGFDIICTSMTHEFGRTFLMTTSDDAVHGRVPPLVRHFNRRSTDLEFFYRPTMMMPQCMMLDSERKRMVTRPLGEFNNMVVNQHGMIPQQFIHCHLVIQPLLGQSLAADAITAVSSARASLMWGDSLDVATSAYECNLVLLCKKWMITHHELDRLMSVGLLPRTDEELIAGFAYRSDNLIKVLWHSLNEELKELILEGTISFHAATTKFALSRGGSKKVVASPSIEGLSFLPSRVSRTICQSRKFKQSLLAKYVRPVAVEERRRAKDKLLSLIDGPPDDIEDELLDRLRDMNKTERVTIEARRISRRHAKPQRQGNRIKWRDGIDIDVVLALREAGVNLGRHPTPEEKEVAMKNDDDLMKWFTSREHKLRDGTTGFRSTTGYPRFMFYNGTMMTRPRSFIFSVDEVMVPRVPLDYTVGPEQFHNFKVVMFGGRTVDTAIQEKALLAFARRKENEGYRYFWKRHQGEVEHAWSDRDDKPHFYIRKGNDKILCLTMADLSPINPIKHGVEVPYEMNFVPGLSGDPIAILNYGNFLNTSARSALRIMNSIFRRLLCARPSDIHRFLPNYPDFTWATNKIVKARTTSLHGSKYVRRLQLIPPLDASETEPFKKIDCTHPSNLVIEGDDEEWILEDLEEQERRLEKYARYY